MNFLKSLLLVSVVGLLSPIEAPAQTSDGRFVVAVVPDTQNYLDFKHQRVTGYPLDASEMLMSQMHFISRNLVANGGRIAFVTHVGDVWQHPTKGIDGAHQAMGLSEDPDNFIVKRYGPDARTVTVEMAAARRAFRILGGQTPMSAVPGNHDYDSFWADSRFRASADPRNPGDNPTPYGVLHYSGLENFNAVLGADSEFFRGKPWYVASFNGGANSAQIFDAGGYRFLHIGLEMAPHDDVIAWATGVIQRYPGLPTMVTIHDHLNVNGERLALATVDLKKVHAEHNNPQDLWEKLLSRHKQIFMVFSGHQHGQSRRVDAGADGGKVWQLLADYQDRNQVVRHLTADGSASGGLGDGWMRLMEFDFSGPKPSVRVRTYSTHFNAYANEIPHYARWYKMAEQPRMTDEQFLGQDEFTIELDDFIARFGDPKLTAR